VWRGSPPAGDPVVDSLADRAVVNGRRWSVRLPAAEARAALDAVAGGPAFAALDDFTLATPTLEDVYLALGGRNDDLERV
jgi:ABC-2 type transport system ATP-binding protein